MSSSETVNDSLQVDAGKVTFADERASALLRDRIGELSHPEQFESWERIKRNSSRTVYRGRIGGKEVYLKHFHSRSVIHRIGRIMGFSDAKFEMRQARYLSAHGVPTPGALAATCSGGVEWYAALGVNPAMPADDWHTEKLCNPKANRRDIQEVLVKLAELIGRMHAAGVIHHDLHCGNILVRTDRGAAPQLVLTDLHRARRSGRLSRRAKAANLAQLFHDRYELTTRTERLRFLKHYLRANGAAGTLRGWQLMVEDFAYRHRRRQYAQRDRRVLGRNRYFSPIRLPGGWRGQVVLASKRRLAGSKAAGIEFTLQQWREALSNPSGLLEGPDVTIVKDSRSGRVIRRYLNVGGHSLDVYIKQPRRKHAWKAVLDCIRPSRAARAFRLGHALLTRKIATALPLAIIERRIGLCPVESILITETVESPRLVDFLGQWLAHPPQEASISASQQRQLARDVLWQLGKMLQRLHDNNYAHRDLKATNILVRWQSGSPPEVVLLDLDGLKRLWRLTERARFQGLMRLNVSLLKCMEVGRPGRLRLLLGYLRRPGSGRINFKPYWRVLDEWSARKLRQQIRSRRRKQRASRRPGR